jgi:hypothetical protein
MLRLNALRHLLDPIGKKGNSTPFDITFVKLSTGEIVNGRCVCLSSNFKTDTLNLRFTDSKEVRTIHFSLIIRYNNQKIL